MFVGDKEKIADALRQGLASRKERLDVSARNSSPASDKSVQANSDHATVLEPLQWYEC